MDIEKITIQECEAHNRHYYNGDYRGSEATPFDLEAMKKFIELRDNKGYKYVDDYSPGKWEAIDVKKSHSRYGLNYVYVDHERKIYRTRQTIGEFYGGSPVD